VGVIDRVELWDPERFEGAVAEVGAGDESERFANQVFG
jgi:DNA-binding transcriptional regulator/RsmH inhibitor MraZ